MEQQDKITNQNQKTSWFVSWIRPALAVPALAVITMIAVLGVVFAPQLTGGTDPASGSPSVAPIAASSSAPTDQRTGNASTNPRGGSPDTAGPAAAPPVRITYEAVGLDVPIHPFTPSESDVAAQSIVPPYTPDGYWLTPYGQPGAGSDNTTYITGHSWEDQDAPFNRLSDQAEVGDTLTVTTSEGRLDYLVESVITHKKDTLKNSDIWQVQPNRLVLISCYTEDLWGKNVVVTAVPA